MRRATCSRALSCLLVTACLLAGCAIAPMKTRTVGATGKENRMDLKFIQADKTTRDEVATKLAWMDTGLKHQRLFWGRWYGSSSGVGAIFAPTEIPLPIPNGERRWHVHNLLAEFNEKGTVERAGEFSDTKLNEGLERWSTGLGEPPLDLSAPFFIGTKVETAPRLGEFVFLPPPFSLLFPVTSDSKTVPFHKTVPIQVTGDLLQFPLRDRDGSTFSVPRNDITRFEIGDWWHPGETVEPPSELNVLFNFRRVRPYGKGHCKCLAVNVSPADYLALVRYMAQTRARP